MTTSPSSVLFPNATATPEFVAVVLASTIGARLFPLSMADDASSCPKHVLPVAGIPLIQRVLQSLQAAGLHRIVLVLAPDDNVTLGLLLDQAQDGKQWTQVATKQHVVLESSGKSQQTTTLSILRRSLDCSGSVEALRQVEQADMIPNQSHLLVLPADLCIESTSSLTHLLQTHINGQRSAACTMMLTDVGDVDEHGMPLKESAKQKKGHLAREPEEIEYMSLQYSDNAAPRVVWKQYKLDVEHDLDLVGTTPKLSLPKSRVREGRVCIRTEWSDVHAYVLAPWVRVLLMVRPNLYSIQNDLIPLLIARQFSGKQKTFGKDLDSTSTEHAATLGGPPGLASRHASTPSEDSSPKSQQQDADSEYTVLASVEKTGGAVRANSIASYLYANKEICHRALAANNTNTRDPCLALPKNVTVKPKFHSLVLGETSMGDKVTIQSTVIGRRCQLGPQCRLKNCVLLDDATIGARCVLQNTVIGKGARIGDNCSLNDCQVGHGKEIASGTKEKNESFVHVIET